VIVLLLIAIGMVIGLLAFGFIWFVIVPVMTHVLRDDATEDL